MHRKLTVLRTNLGLECHEKRLELPSQPVLELEGVASRCGRRTRKPFAPQPLRLFTPHNFANRNTYPAGSGDLSEKIVACRIFTEMLTNCLVNFRNGGSCP